MSELDIKLYSPHPKQREVHDDSHRFKVLNWGRRTGKSTLAVNHMLLKASQRRGRYWIVAPTYKQAKNIYWLDIIHNQIPKELILKKNEQELIITLINGSIIELKGADNEDSLRGAGINGVILDEYAFMKPIVWELIIQPMLSDGYSKDKAAGVEKKDRAGWAIFISTPDGFNHFYDLVNAAQRSDKEDWWYSHATSYDNPFLASEEIDRIKEDTTEDQFAQEYMAEFKKMTGLVYKLFDRKTHVVSSDKLPDLRGCTLGVGIDFGFTNPTAVVFVAMDYDANWWVYDEIYKSGMTTEQTAYAIKSKMGKEHFTYKVGDSAQAQEIANLNAYPHAMGIDPINKSKDSIESGIRLINDMLKVRDNGKPKLFISENCEDLIFEFETYRYPEKKADKNESEQPMKENDHLLDALRYLKLKLYYGNPALKAHKPQGMLDRKYRRR